MLTSQVQDTFRNKPSYKDWLPPICDPTAMAVYQSHGVTYISELPQALATCCPGAACPGKIIGLQCRSWPCWRTNMPLRPDSMCSLGTLCSDSLASATCLRQSEQCAHWVSALASTEQLHLSPGIANRTESSLENALGRSTVAVPVQLHIQACSGAPRLTCHLALTALEIFIHTSRALSYMACQCPSPKRSSDGKGKPRTCPVFPAQGSLGKPSWAAVGELRSETKPYRSTKLRFKTVRGSGVSSRTIIRLANGSGSGWSSRRARVNHQW